VIRYANWIVKERRIKNANEIDICFFSMRDVGNDSVLRRIVHCIKRFLFLAYGKNNNSLYNSYDYKNTSEFQFNGLKIKLIKINKNKNKTKEVMAKSNEIFEAITNKNNSEDSLLALEYRGIHIGDLIASNAFRRDYISGGSLKYVSNIKELISNAIEIVDECYSLNDEKIKNAYVMTPELTYLHNIYVRALRRRGVKYFEHHAYNGEYRIIQPSDEYRHPRIIHDRLSYELTHSERLIAKSYIEERLNSGGKSLWYMCVGANTKEKTDTKIYEILSNKSSKKMINVVIFLHSFDDGQYFYGLDGFSDLYEWIEFTIINLMTNKNIQTILLKPHPNINYMQETTDAVAIQRLKSKFRSHVNVVWLEKDIDILSFFPNIDLVITHHGSIAEEMAFMRIPVIGSQCAPWGSVYKFVSTWKNKEQYKQMLNDLNTPLDTYNMVENDLFEFIYRYRIDAKNIFDKSSVWIYSSLENKCATPEVSISEYNKYECKLKKLNDNSLYFDQLINHY